MIGKKLESLQVLRAFAAIAVVLFHAFTFMIDHGTAKNPLNSGAFVPPHAWVHLGEIGVDVFFILSGFLMVHIAEPYLSGRRSVGNFLAHRLIRIWPLYALITAYACAVLLAKAHHGGIAPYNLQWFRLGSFLFIPSFNEKGVIQPILTVGWTLNYEMLFYLCFAGAMLTGPKYLLAKLAGLLALVMVAAFAMRGTAIGQFYSNPVILEFLFGAVICGVVKARKPSPPLPALWLAAGIAGWIACGLLLDPSLPRPLGLGLPAALIFIGFMGLEGTVIWPRWLLFLGNASYSIYLVHILIVYPVAKPFAAALQHNHLAPISILVASIIGAVGGVALGAVCFIVVERPLLRACTTFYDRVTGRTDAPPLVAQ